MEQTIEIPVEIRGAERVYLGRVQTRQYGLRFLVDVDGVEMTLERDDAERLPGDGSPKVVRHKHYLGIPYCRL